MTRRRIIVTLGRDGMVRAETSGILGGACLEVIPLLEDLLDAEAVDSFLTADYHEVEASAETHLPEELGVEEQG